MYLSSLSRKTLGYLDPELASHHEELQKELGPVIKEWEHGYRGHDEAGSHEAVLRDAHLAAVNRCLLASNEDST